MDDKVNKAGRERGNEGGRERRIREEKMDG